MDNKLFYGAVALLVLVSVIGYSADDDWDKYSHIILHYVVTNNDNSVDADNNGIIDKTDAGLDDILNNNNETNKEMTVGGLSSTGDIISQGTIIGRNLQISSDVHLPQESIGTNELADGAITSSKIANNAVTSSKIADGSITSNDLSNMGCSNGQILKLQSGKWSCSNDNSGSSTVWSKSGNNIYYNSGNVGVGVNNPQVPLEVNDGLFLNTHFHDIDGNGEIDIVDALHIARYSHGLSVPFTVNKKKYTEMDVDGDGVITTIDARLVALYAVNLLDDDPLDIKSKSSILKSSLYYNPQDSSKLYSSVDLDMQNHKIINLGTPTDNNDAATKGYVDSKVASAGGGTSVYMRSYSFNSYGVERAISNLCDSGDVLIGCYLRRKDSNCNYLDELISGINSYYYGGNNAVGITEYSSGTGCRFYILGNPVCFTSGYNVQVWEKCMKTS